MSDNPTTSYLTAHAHEVGKLVLSVSLFDDDLTTLLSQCFALSEFQENALLRPMNTRAKIETLNRIGKLFMNPEEQKALSTWCQTAKDKLDERNEVIHGQPGLDAEGEPTFRLYSGKRGIFGKPETWSIIRVWELMCSFGEMSDQIRNEVYPQFQTWIEKARGGAQTQPTDEQTPPEK